MRTRILISQAAERMKQKKMFKDSKKNFETKNPQKIVGKFSKAAIFSSSFLTLLVFLCYYLS